ncbi:hypothetical protein PFISCL1PPCAC_6435, partial [Pristionchus fissidentatus]
SHSFVLSLHWEVDRLSSQFSRTIMSNSSFSHNDTTPQSALSPASEIREERISVERRRRAREAAGFKRLREILQIIKPDVGSKLEKSDILEQTASILQGLWTEKQREKRSEEAPDSTTPRPMTYLSPSTPSSFLSISPAITPPSEEE